MKDLDRFPRGCRKNIRRLMYMLSADADTVYAMMQMTALLMDLRVEDRRVVDAILMDCGMQDMVE